MANATFTDQPQSGVVSLDAVEAVTASYRAHRQNGDSDLASYQAALSAYLDHFGRQPLGEAARVVRTIIRQATANSDQHQGHCAIDPIAAY